MQSVLQQLNVLGGILFQQSLCYRHTHTHTNSSLLLTLHLPCARRILATVALSYSLSILYAEAIRRGTDYGSDLVLCWRGITERQSHSQGLFSYLSLLGAMLAEVRDVFLCP